MNMAQRAARHAEMHKQEGLLPHAGAHGEDVEAERLRSMFARLITSFASHTPPVGQKYGIICTVGAVVLALRRRRCAGAA